MPLQGSQVRAIQSPVFRAHWPDKTALWAQVDDLIKTRGEGCSRIHAIWDLLLSPSQADLALWDWMSQTFPGVALRAGGGTYPRPVPGTSKPQPVTVTKHSPVRRALDVLQSYRKS